MSKTREIILLDDVYDWKTMTLWKFLQEGNIPEGWEDFFERKDVCEELWKISEEISKSETYVYPMIEHVFRAFIPVDKIRCITMGQDCYHNGTNRRNGSAMGLCFSVKPGNTINPSLKNIYKELKNEGFNPTEDGNLLHWRDQGCFMINAALTVEMGNPGSHSHIWKRFTEFVVKHVVKNTKNTVWLLMGKDAQFYDKYITDVAKTHTVFFTTHPSPFSANKLTRDVPAFLGSGVFQAINDVLDVDINW